MPFDQIKEADHSRRPHLQTKPKLDPRTWLLAVGGFATGTDLLAIPGIVPAVAHGLSVPLEAAGQLVTAYGVAYAIGAPTLAVLTAKKRTDHMVVWALLALSLANLTAALAPNFAVLLAARVAAGLSVALFSPSAYLIASSMAAPERKGAALGVVAIGMTSAALAGVPVALALAHTFDWRASFVTVAVLASLGIVALLLKRLPETRAQAHVGLKARLAPLTEGRVLITLLPLLLWGAGNFTLYTFLGGYAHAHGYDGNAVTLLMLALGLGSLIGSQIAGPVSDRFGPTRPVLVFLAASTVNLAVLPFAAQHAASLAAAFFFFGFFVWSNWTPQQARVIAVNPKAANVTLALGNSTLYAASAIGAGIGATVAAHWSVNELPLVAAALTYAGFSVIAVGAAIKRSRRLAAA